MSNIHQLKRRINTSKNISKITKAMEMVAASKMKKAQDQAVSSRPYSQALFNSLQMLAGKTDSLAHPLLSHHSAGKPVAVIISTDKGLCGALNTNLFKMAHAWAEQNPEGAFIAIGKKAVDFARKTDLELHAQFTEMPDRLTTRDLLPISSVIVEGFLNQQFNSVKLFYTDFVNTLVQKTKIDQLLPLDPKPLEEVEVKTKQLSAEPIYVFEPSVKDVLEELLPYYVENSIFQALLEAKASEHSARMVAMKNASENADDLGDELRLIFNKTRQENITTELLDITTATLTVS